MKKNSWLHDKSWSQVCRKVTSSSNIVNTGSLSEDVLSGALKPEVEKFGSGSAHVLV